jgi:hypothetical protein
MEQARIAALIAALSSTPSGPRIAGIDYLGQYDLGPVLGLDHYHTFINKAFQNETDTQKRRLSL